ncbi:hypothetical protein [Streptomyces sp. NPDC001422]|uniref:hypothetical protein n=1 Tax=Streptomyces sp. NPDC001422 TaxID=3364575 RepID=UPI003682313C
MNESDTETGVIDACERFGDGPPREAGEAAVGSPSLRPRTGAVIGRVPPPEAE